MMTVEYFVCSEEGGETVAKFNRMCDECRYLDTMVEKDCHFFGKYLSGNDNLEVAFDDGDVFFLPPCHYSNFMATMEANGLEEPFEKKFVMQAIDFMLGLLSDVKSENIDDAPVEDRI